MRTGRRLALGAAACLIAAGAGLAVGPYGEPLHRLPFGASPGLYLEGLPAGGLYRGEVRRLVEELARERYRRPVNASIDRRTGRVLPDREGLNVTFWPRSSSPLRSARL